MQTTPEKSINFTPTSVEDAAKVASPAEHAAHMKKLDNQFSATSEKQGKLTPEDSLKMEALVADLEKPSVSQEVFGGKVETPEEQAEYAKAEKSLRSYLGIKPGELLEGSRRQIGDLVLEKRFDNERKLSDAVLPTIGAPVAVVAAAGLGAWIAAGSGIGVSTSIAGIPLMTAAALSAVPLAVAVVVLGVTVHGIRSYLHSRKYRKARDQAYK